VITKPIEDDYEFIEKLTMKKFMNNTTTSQEELPSEVPNIFESVFFEKVRKKVTDSSEDFKCTSQEITDTVEGSNSNSLRHSQTEPMSFANETVKKVL